MPFPLPTVLGVIGGTVEQAHNTQQEEPFEFAEQLEALYAMGVADQEARTALIASNGNVGEAMELLFE
jgi:NACalpha-BTF3-like transcription factor